MEQNFISSISEMEDKIEEYKRTREEYDKKTQQLNIEFAQLVKIERSVNRKTSKLISNQMSSQGNNNNTNASDQSQQPPQENPSQLTQNQ